MILKISQDEAAVAAKQILGFYPDIPASDPKRFAAGLVALLSTYPGAVVARAVDPRSGIAAHVEFLNFARIKKLLDEWSSDYFKTVRRQEIASRQALPEPTVNPEARKRVADGLRQLTEGLQAGMIP